MVRSILFLVFPNVGEQDVIAPWELMRSVAWTLHERGETLDVSLGSFEKGVVPTQMGTVIQPARMLSGAGVGAASVVSPRRAWKILPDQRIFSTGGAGTVHPSTIALAWHLFGDEVGRGLAAGWDAWPLFGESLFSLDGPVMHDDEQVKRSLQDAREDVFLPEAAQV